MDNETGGDCVGMGWEWSAETRTCVMTTDFEVAGGIDAIHIENDHVTLDGHGHNVIGSGTGNGITVRGMNDVTVMNTNVARFSVGLLVSKNVDVVSSGSTLSGNTADQCAMGAFLNDAQDSTITGNTFRNSGYGINLSNGSGANLVTRNTITGNSDGILVILADNNTFTFNTISSNTTRGICIENTSGNTFYSNALTGNATQAAFYGTGTNSYDGGPSIGGNYWSNWTSPDVDSDGFVDLPFVFSGGQDNYPLTTSTGWDRTAPVITNQSPTGIIRTGTPVFTASYTDPEPSAGINAASATVEFWPHGPETYSCTATGSPSGTISCTWTDPGTNPHLEEGNYYYLLSITDNQGHTTTIYQEFQVLPYQVTDSAGGGDCQVFGSWDPETKTCTITRDISDVERLSCINIASDGVTLDGNGYTIRAVNPVYNGEFDAVKVINRTGVTVRNIKQDGFVSGIYLSGSSGCTISDSQVSATTGITMFGSSNNVIQGCTLTGSYCGIYMDLASNSNQIRNNTLTGSSSGINIASSSSNTVTGNVFQSNYRGFYSFASTNTQIYNNVFDGNTMHAYMEAAGSGNVFNLAAPIGGNWWSGWTSPDVNSDGFVDSPYTFTGGQDNLPWVTQAAWDNSPPVITNVQPSGVIRDGNPTFTADYSDPETSSGVNVASVGGTFTQDPWYGTPTLTCTASGSPSGTISCTVDPYGLIMNGHYEFELHITDNMGHTGTATGSFDYLAYHITNTSGGGDCGQIGTWNEATKTCTLDADLTTDWAEAIHIEGSGITLDGAGHMITGTGPLADGVPNYGVYVPGQNGVTVKNLTIRSFYVAIQLANTNGSTVVDNDLANNMQGINLWSGCNDNIIAHNIADPVGSWGVYQYGGTRNSYYDNHFNATGSLGRGFRIDTASGNQFLGNTVTGSDTGFELLRSNSNTFIGNIVQSSGTGIRMHAQSTANTIKENLVRNNGYAVGLSDTPDNLIYHNRFENNTNQVYGAEPNSFNGGDSIGGNYWSTYDSPAEGCNDLDKNGFCDAPFNLYTTNDDPGIVVSDNEPWTVPDGWKPEYYWTWYDNLYARNWVMLANPASATEDIWYDLTVAGIGRTLPSLGTGAAGQVPPGKAIAAAYTGVMGGPVEAGCRATTEGLTSQRILWSGNSLEEVLGTEAEKLSSHFYWTWYDQQSAGFANWVMVANPNSFDVYYRVKIAGLDPGAGSSGIIPAGESVTPAFAGVMGGPVEVEAWSDAVGGVTPADVLASQRVLSNGGAAFNEVPGIPASELRNDYLWTWYDNASPGATDWIMIANPSATESMHYEILIGGAQVQSDTTGGTGTPAGLIPPGGYITPVFTAPAVPAANGPVEVRTYTDESHSTPMNSIASQRVLWGPSFEEVPGYPESALASTYHWTWYDQKSPGALNWVMVALEPGETRTVHVEVSYKDEDNITRTGGATLDPVNPDQMRWFWSDPGYRGGPIQVAAHLADPHGTPVNVIASQRVLWNGYFNEVVGTVID